MTALEPAAERVVTDITVGGMTCAACVRRVERKLGELAGVMATVNLATGLARVSHPADITPESLVAAVEQAGYQAALPVSEDDEGPEAADEEEAADRRERERITVTALLAVPVLVLSMVPALQFRDWQWLCPLADPIVLGFSYGATLGAVLVITLGGGVALAGLGVSAAAFLGAVAAGALVFALGRRHGRMAPTRLVLAGVAVGYVFLSATSFAQLQATPTELRTVMFWMLGSVAGAQWDQLPTVAAVVLTTTVLLSLFGRRLNVLLAGDESATALGVDVNRLRAVLLVLSALLTGTVVAVAGSIGFVGLMIPHLVRLTTGADHRRLLPLTALLGALYLVLVDLLSRTLDRPDELPLGIITALLGAPFFLWLLRRNKGLD
nr:MULTISPECIES: iron chelate uptake ABC transporter family permease subunit [Streptomyces]